MTNTSIVNNQKTQELITEQLRPLFAVINDQDTEELILEKLRPLFEVSDKYDTFKHKHPYVVTGIYTAYKAASVALDSLSLYNTARLFSSINPVGAAIAGAGSSICSEALPYILPTQSDNFCDKLKRHTIVHFASLAAGTCIANAAGYPITFGSVFLVQFTANMISLATLAGIGLTLVAIGGSIYYLSQASLNHRKVSQI